MRIKIADIMKCGFDETIAAISFILAIIVSLLKNLGSIIAMIKDFRRKFRSKKVRKNKLVGKNKNNR